jgi:alkylhydroperoxidase family enzyme
VPWKTRFSSRHEGLIGRLADGVLEGQGTTDPVLRRSVESRAASLSGRPTPGQGELPETIWAYVDKIAFHAYKVTDDDINALLTAGYSEDAILEITVSAALGAGLARLECGLAALKGEK